MQHFRCFAKTDGARPSPVTVSIDRRCGLVYVRPYRRRRQYILPLAAVAEMIVLRVVRAELAERARTKQRRCRRGK